MTSVPRLRDYRGVTFLSYGFRPFFLLGAFYAGLAILLWLLILTGHLKMATAFSPIEWHIHEMLYGYFPAVVTGFLLTAVPNWTGRLPLQGGPLLFLVSSWLAGRIAVTFPGHMGWQLVAVVDSAFLTLVFSAISREIIIGRNWGNLRVLGPLAVLLAGNISFHVEAHFRGTADYAFRIGIAAMILLIVVIGGRIVPSFTRNWLARENPGRLPAPFGNFDRVVIVATAVSLAMWIVRPFGYVTAFVLALAACVNFVRLARWAGIRAARDRLVLILHIGYAFVPLGFLLSSAGALEIVMTSAGVHAWTVGAAGTMTLAVMTRATLGHTGNALVASTTTHWIFGAVVVAAFARVAASFEPGWAELFLGIAAIAWCLAFFGFVASFGRMLMSEKRSKR